MKIFAIAITALSFMWSGALQAEEFAFEEGTHYVALEVPIKLRDESKIQVAEYFSYGCPHCYLFEPLIGAWKEQLGDDVTFVRTPAVWNRDYQVYAQTYVTLEAMDMLDKAHIGIFNAIHDQRRRLNSPQLMAEFLVGFGIPAEDFARTYNSFGVRAALQQADSAGRAYRSTGVPALVINGRYRIEGGMAGSNANMLRVADFLIAKERQRLAAAD
ncbi:MAG: thiol:disulfide interchange protein DsbA/DsbL [Pseudomonadales bacterium]